MKNDAGCVSAQPSMTLVLVRKRLSKMIGMYNMCIQPYSFPWYWSFKYLSKWLILYWIYIDRGTPPPSPTSLSIASWRRNTSWCFTNPLRLEQNPSKLGSVPLQPKKIVKQKLSVSQLPLNVLCGEILLVWNLYLKKKHYRWWELTSDSTCLVQTLSARLNTSNCSTC